MASKVMVFMARPKAQFYALTLAQRQAAAHEALTAAAQYALARPGRFVRLGRDYWMALEGELAARALPKLDALRTQEGCRDPKTGKMVLR